MARLPDIKFLKQNRVEIEFETFKLSHLYARRDHLDNRLDRDHRIQFYLLLLITKGTGIHRVDFQPYPYDEGSVIFISKEQVHAFDTRSRSDGIVILFTEQFLNKHVIHSDILFLHRLFNYHLHTPVIHNQKEAGENLSLIFNQIHDEYHSTSNYAKEELLSALLKILLIKAERIKKPVISKDGASGWVDLFIRFKNLVSENHTQTRNAKDYAAKLNISYKHLNETSKAATGNTPKQFIDNYLILEIKRQLAISNLSIKELTYHFGFDEPTNFLKFFKKHAAQTPAQFRNTLTS